MNNNRERWPEDKPFKEGQHRKYIDAHGNEHTVTIKRIDESGPGTVIEWVIQ